MKNKIVMVRKAMALALTMCIVAGMSQNVFAGPSQTKTKTVSPFGTIIAQQEYVGYIRGRKNINFEVTTTNKSSVLIAKVDILDYATGVKLDGDMSIMENTRRAGYTCDCHSTKANTRAVSSFGCHEVRGKTTGVVIYTKLANLK